MGAWRTFLTIGILMAIPASAAARQQAGFQTRFGIKYVAEGAVYLNAGRAAGLAEGQKLTVRRNDPQHPEGRAIAEIEVVSVASSSAACQIRTSTEAVQIGDEAQLSADDAEVLRKARAVEESRKYAQVIMFTEGDTLEQEARASVPRPRSPEINRVRGRIGFEYSAIRDSEIYRQTSSLGLILRIDATRILGTYWNLSGYYRGRLSRQSDSSQETLSDLIQRTYHLHLTYNNPGSHWVAGFGRLYLPWATSLGTMDGGYFGRRLGRRFTLGLFGGSSPDPTSWRYDRDRQLIGSFVNLEGGSFEAFRYSATVGAASGRIRWRPDREFGFLESNFLYKRYLSVYYNAEADILHSADPAQQSGPALSRSFLTVRVQPHRRVSFDINHNYFRDVPTFDARLVGTGLVDRLLFHGLNAGVRLELPYGINPYASFGRSGKTGDTRNSWNQMFGIAVSDIIRTKIRADLRYSKFDSAFGHGRYRSISLTRPFGEGLRFEVQAGQQDFNSPLTAQNNAWWVNSNADWIFSGRYFFGGGFTLYNSPGQGYKQWYLNLGYGF